MEVIYATLLLNESGREINETNLTSLLGEVGVSVEQSRIKALVAALEGVNLESLDGIEPSQGLSKINSETDDRNSNQPRESQPLDESDSADADESSSRPGKQK